MTAKTTVTADPAPDPAPVPMPPLGPQGFPTGPMLYPRMLRQVTALIESLVAFEAPDPERQENSHFALVQGAAIAIYNEEEISDNDPMTGLAGWVTQIDTACWVFVPYAPPARRRRKRATS